MAITLVQSKGAASGSVTLNSPTTAGNCLIVCTGNMNSSGTVSSVKISGAADHFAKSVSAAEPTDADSEIWADPNCVGGQTAVAVTWASSATVGVWVMEWAGLLSSGVVDKTNSGVTAGASTVVTGATGTLSNPVELIIATFGVFGPLGTPSGPSSGGWTNLANQGGTSPVTQMLASYQVVSASTSLTYTGNTGNSSSTAAATIATFLPAPAIISRSSYQVNQAVMRAALW